jgi:hypothetical protein
VPYARSAIACSTKADLSARLTFVLASSICDHPAIAPDAKQHPVRLNAQRPSESADEQLRSGARGTIRGQIS